MLLRIGGFILYVGRRFWRLFSRGVAVPIPNPRAVVCYPHVRAQLPLQTLRVNSCLFQDDVKSDNAVGSQSAGICSTWCGKVLVCPRETSREAWTLGDTETKFLPKNCIFET